MNALVQADAVDNIIEQVLLKGDIAKLTPDERTGYYLAVCRSTGLNPLTKPFEFIVLNGKMVLYALRGCTDQLRSIHDVSVEEMRQDFHEGIVIVTCKVRNGKGRTDMSTGAVNISGLKGEILANALMKAETKAKRRATLSLCGLGMLDETEVADIPQARASAPPPPQSQMPQGMQYYPSAGVLEPPPSPPQQRGSAPPPPPVSADEGRPHRIVLGKGSGAPAWAEAFIKAVGKATSSAETQAWIETNSPILANLATSHPDLYARVQAATTTKHESFEAPPVADAPPDPTEDPDAAIDAIKARLFRCQTQEDLEEYWNLNIEPTKEKWFPPDLDLLLKEFEHNEVRIAAEQAK